MAAKRLRLRQDTPRTASASSSKPSFKQPTTTIALSTTFTPAASCASNKLTMLAPPGYFIWANEPVPFANMTVTNCYPPEFLRSYTSIASDVDQSSIVPVMSPLVCPQNFCTQFVADYNYVACCPSGYSFAPPATPMVRDRPGYGGTCYSDFTVSSTVTVLKYDESGSTNLAPFVATTSVAQAYAHPIDGFAPSAPKLGCALLTSSASLNTTSVSSSPVTSSTATTNPESISSRAIAGIVLGSVCGLAVIVVLVFLLLLRRRRVQRLAKGDEHREIHQADDSCAQNRAKGSVGLKATNNFGFEHAKECGGSDIHEMNAEPVHELSGIPADMSIPHDMKYVEKL